MDNKGDEAQITVNEIIKKHISESETLQNISILEAKIFVYEEIISKSNFAPMIKPKNKKMKHSREITIPKEAFKNPKINDEVFLEG